MIQQVQDDLRFVRRAIARRDRPRRADAAIYGVWAAYVAVGYFLLDVAPAAAGWFFLIGGFAGAAASAALARRRSRRVGELDRRDWRRRNLHFLGGIVLSIAATWALAAIVPELRGTRGGQLNVVMIGLVYFLGGVHFERGLLWLGPVLMVGGLLVSMVPRYGWTALGGVIAAGLLALAFLPRRSQNDAAMGDEPRSAEAA